MKKLNCGCGGNKLSGWLNTDYDAAVRPEMVLDISKKLPFNDGEFDFIFNEHVIEHISQKEGYNFMKECLRILVPGGVLRIATPDIERIAYFETDNYRLFQKHRGWGDGTKGCGLKAIIFNHGHQYVYSKTAMDSMLYGVGFTNIKFHDVGQSDHPELRGVEGHHGAIGDEFNRLETFCVEAQKP